MFSIVEKVRLKGTSLKLQLDYLLSNVRKKEYLAKRKSQHEKPVQGDDTDDEGSHFTGEKTEESCRLTDNTGPPGLVLQHVLAGVERVCRPYYGQVDTHEEISQAQVGHKHRE